MHYGIEYHLAMLWSAMLNCNGEATKHRVALSPLK